MRRTAVIGAGPAGCAAAWSLRCAGRSVVLFERNPRPGGRTASWRGEGVVLDTGAGFFTSFYPRTRALVRELGLEGEVLELSRANGLVHDGRVATLALGSLRSFLALPTLSPTDKLRVLAYGARQTVRRGRLDLADPATLAPFDDRDAAEEARRTMGPRALDFLVRSAIEPFWYFRCEDASRALLVALQAHAADARFFAFRPGMDRLCRRLAEEVETRCGREVRALEPAASGAGVRVRHAAPGGGAPEAESFDEAVVATPARAADALTASLPEDQVTPAQRAFLRAQRYAANVHVAYRTPRLGRRPYDNLYPCGPGRHAVAGIGFHARKLAAQGAEHPGDGFVSVYLSDEASRPLLAEGDARCAEEAWRLARGLDPTLPETARPIGVFARGEAIPVPAVGRYREAARLLADQRRRRPAVVLAGDHLATATIEGAVYTGRQAAASLLGEG
ncbi:MAG: FAD-dependent oxidoreductase [Myxococcota bacterium]|nr:FAD-dependent oxidoreductase [Myxococcota bacterium]